MPGKWGGARRARPPLDPPMYSFSVQEEAFQYCRNVDGFVKVMTTGINPDSK